MARNKLSPLFLTTRDSTSQKTMTEWCAVDTATGCYIDLTGYKGDKVILAICKTATNVAGTTATQIRIQCCTNQKFSGYGKGDLEIRGTSNVAATNFKGQFCGPFDLSRFKDSNERININCTKGTNVGWIGAIIIE
jgi:hypothetical protein